MINRKKTASVFLILGLSLCLWGCSGKKAENAATDAASAGSAVEAETRVETEKQEKETAASGKISEVQTEKESEIALTEAEAATEAVSEKPEDGPKENGFSVCIDPGHQGSWVDMSEQEPDGPGSSNYKAKATTGTTASFTGVPEYQLNLDISLLLKNELISRGYRVVMTREDNDTAISNSQRAILSAKEGCDISVRIHANGSEDPSVSGALAMVMSPGNPYVGALYGQSHDLAQKILDNYCESTGFINMGIQEVDNMTGLNWSKIPVMILEMGYMTNEQDDYAMEDAKMQSSMVKGIADGIDEYFGIDSSSAKALDELESITEGEFSMAGLPVFGPPVSDLVSMYLAGREMNGEKWAVSFEKLDEGDGLNDYIAEYNAYTPMQSASVIKVFIMGAIYERVCYPDENHEAVYFQESYDGELRSLLENMISVSDNDCANRLIEIAGGGDFEAGKQVINEFCREHGYMASHVGRRFLDSNPTDDNYTCAADCRKILSEIYRGTLVNEEASAKMLDLLRMQTVRHKIPAGLPADFTSASKTGEMPEGYGLGCIENDIAIIFSPYGDYILTILSNDLGGRNEEAQYLFHDLSSYVASWMMDGANTASSSALMLPETTVPGGAQVSAAAEGGAEGAPASAPVEPYTDSQGQIAAG